MAIRAQYEQQLQALHQQLLWLSQTVEQAIVRATWALLHRDAAAARQSIAGDRAINELRYDLEDQALLLIARQQPSAGDLRQLSALISVASELERIGDYAEGISKIVLRSEALPPIQPPHVIHEMAQTAREMLRLAIHAVTERDPSARERLETIDDQVDQLYQRALALLIASMREAPAQIEAATYLLWAAHNLERIADRTVNIAERAAFIAGSQWAQDRA